METLAGVMPEPMLVATAPGCLLVSIGQPGSQFAPDFMHNGAGVCLRGVSNSPPSRVSRPSSLFHSLSQKHMTVVDGDEGLKRGQQI